MLSEKRAGPVIYPETMSHPCLSLGHDYRTKTARSCVLQPWSTTCLECVHVRVLMISLPALAVILDDIANDLDDDM